MLTDAIDRESLALDLVSKLQAKSGLKTKALQLLSRREKHAAAVLQMQARHLGHIQEQVGMNLAKS